MEDVWHAHTQWAGKGLVMVASPINLHLWHHSSLLSPDPPTQYLDALHTPHSSPYPPTRYPFAQQCERHLNRIWCQSAKDKTLLLFCYLCYLAFWTFVTIFRKWIQLNSSLQIDMLRAFGGGILWNNSSSPFPAAPVDKFNTNLLLINFKCFPEFHPTLQIHCAKHRGSQMSKWGPKRDQILIEMRPS